MRMIRTYCSDAGRRRQRGNVVRCWPGWKPVEDVMMTGAFIVESLRVGTVLEGLDLTVQRLSRAEIPDATSDQPRVWTLVEFVTGRRGAAVLAETLAGALEAPGWYANFETARTERCTWSSRTRSSSAGR